MPYIAPNSPVADWRCVPHGHGYGNYFDPVTGTWASVTRTTPKTARVAADRLVDVPAGYLALEPWSLHKAGGVGLAAIIEEARTNAYLDSYFAAADISAAWASDGTLTRSTDVPAVYGTHVAKAVYIGGAGDSGAIKRLLAQERPYSAGQNVTVSGWVRGSASGLTVQRFIEALDSGGAVLGTVTANITLGTWERGTLTYTGLPTGTAKTRSGIRAIGVDENDTVTLYASAAQSEVGSFATSYIPTTTAAVTRNADVVTVPTTGWNAATGTLVAIANTPNPAMNASYPPYLVALNPLGVNCIVLYFGSATIVSFWVQGADGVTANTTRSPVTAGVHVLAGRWTDSAIRAFADGVGGSSVATDPTTSIRSYAAIGSSALNATQFVLNGPIARLTVYDKALTEEQLASADMTTDMLAGLDTARITNEVTL